jgi:hypothetical protein
MQAKGFRRISALLTMLVVVPAVGCGQRPPEQNVAPVRGKILYNGQPVTSGVIRFRPVEVPGAKQGVLGRPASGEVKNDGTFVLTTYSQGDGAVVGKHEVSYVPVAKGAEGYEDKPEQSPYVGLVPKERMVEVKPGSNEITIELVRAQAGMR